MNKKFLIILLPFIAIFLVSCTIKTQEVVETPIESQEEIIIIDDRAQIPEEQASRKDEIIIETPTEEEPESYSNLNTDDDVFDTIDNSLKYIK